MRPQALDLSSMVARVVLAVLTAATVVLLGLALRASDALGFASTLLSVSVSYSVASFLRGERVGPPTAAARRFQPLVDAFGTVPGGRTVGRPAFKRGVTAIGVGLVVATATTIVSSLIFNNLYMAPLWRGVFALAPVLIPVNLFFSWSRSRQTFTGTKFAAGMSTAIYQVAFPTRAPESVMWSSAPVKVRIATSAGGRTAATLLGRIFVQTLIPVVFGTPLSIAFVAVATITLVAGGPVFLALGRTLRQPQTAAVEAQK